MNPFLHTRISAPGLILVLSLLSAFFMPVRAEAARSDCNKTKEPDACRKAYDRCDTKITPYSNKAECLEGAIQDYGGGIRNGGGGKNNGGGGGGNNSPGSNSLTADDKKNGYVSVCGKGDDAIKVQFNFGCQGDKLPDEFSNPIYDLAFSVIRFLSAGVGIVVVLAIILAGVKYSTAEGNPEETMKAKSNIRSALIALLIYIFAFSIIQWLVPGGVFN